MSVTIDSAGMQKQARPAQSAWVPGVCFIVLGTLGAHLLFSRFGLNPTDDGFTLAYSRRLLDGQVPHRDFIMLRPALSPLLHLPVVALAGDYVLWVSRMVVWFQFACMSWAWVIAAQRLLKVRLGALHAVSLAAIAFAFSAHDFPAMAWHTVDGLFLASLGVVLCVGESKRAKQVGYLLIAAAYLCKQNFLVLAPAVMLILGDWRQARYWASVATPGLLYLVYLALNGALADASVQFTTQSGLLEPGVIEYLESYSFEAGGLIGFLALRSVYKSEKPIRARLAGAVTVGVLLLWAIISLAGAHTCHPSLTLFGVLLGSALAALKRRDPAAWKSALLPLAAAWCASISIGYSTPALGMGPVIAVILVHVYRGFEGSRERWTVRAATAVFALLTLAAFANVRLQHIYRERPSGELTCRLGGVLPGANNIQTNRSTFAFLQDLQAAISKADGRRYCVLPDLACCWIKAEQGNPLPIDWVFATELNHPQLVRRTEQALQAEGLVVIVQKLDAAGIASEQPAQVNNTIVDHVKSSMNRIGETEYFELYSR